MKTIIDRTKKHIQCTIYNISQHTLEMHNNNLLYLFPSCAVNQVVVSQEGELGGRTKKARADRVESRVGCQCSPYPNHMPVT